MASSIAENLRVVLVDCGDDTVLVVTETALLLAVFPNVSIAWATIW
jgi:hypothetical protein